MVVVQKSKSGMSTEPVVIVGAGWAGLAAAVKLTEQGHQVIIFESAKQAGGRARGVHFNDMDVDNGQHLLIGAYTECLSLMETVGININTSLKRLPLLLTVINKPTIDEERNTLTLQAPALPAPLHLLYALITAKGLTFKDKVSGIKFGLTLKKYNYAFEQDVFVKELFNRTKQTQTLIQQLWEPLCLATMNTAIEDASANVFMRIFKDAFTIKTNHTDSLLPSTDLSNLFPNAAIDFIEKNGGKVIPKSRVESIDVNNNEVSSVKVKVGSETETVKTSQVIIATAPQNLNKLISQYPILAPTSKNIDQFNYEPIVTVYLKYADEVHLPQAMMGLSSTISQWVFDRGSFCQQSGLFSVVISANGAHMSMDDDTLTQIVHDEVSALLGEKPALINAFVIREKRATFACTKNINKLRPKNTTAINGLYLAGDYTDTGYPATLEGAVRSGITASNLIIEKRP